MEILGKVLARKISDRFVRQEGETQSTGFFATLRQIWNNFIQLIKNTISPQVKRQFDLVMDEIADKVLTHEIIEKFDHLGLAEADTVMNLTRL